MADNGQTTEVILITDSMVTSAEATKLISNYFDSFKTLTSTFQGKMAIKEEQPQLIFFALSQFEQNIQFYVELTDENLLSYEHNRILLCDEQDVSASFLSCSRGIFDDYVAFKPATNVPRLMLHINQYASTLSSDFAQTNSQVKSYLDVNDELTFLIAQAGEMNRYVDDKQDEITDFIFRFTDEFKRQFVKSGKLKKLYGQERCQQILKRIDALTDQSLFNRADKDQAVNELLSSDENKSSGNSQEPLLTKSHTELNQASIYKQKQTGLSNNAAESSHKKHRILIVEDNEIYQQITKNILIEQGFTVDLALTGHEALKQVSSNIYDLIFMDLFLPDINGMVMTKHIRANNKNAKTPIVALTTNRKKEIVEKWATQGLSGYLVKPSSAVEISKMVNKVLNKTESAS